MTPEWLPTAAIVTLAAALYLILGAVIAGLTARRTLLFDDFHDAWPLILLWPVILTAVALGAALYYAVAVPLRWVFDAVAGR